MLLNLQFQIAVDSSLEGKVMDRLYLQDSNSLQGISSIHWDPYVQFYSLQRFQLGMDTILALTLMDRSILLGICHHHFQFQHHTTCPWDIAGSQPLSFCITVHCMNQLGIPWAAQSLQGKNDLLGMGLAQDYQYLQGRNSQLDTLRRSRLHWSLVP